MRPMYRVSKVLWATTYDSNGALCLDKWYLFKHNLEDAGFYARASMFGKRISG